MSSDLSLYIVHYGYLAVFILIFFQELGLPNPVPSELTLLVSGYLSSVGVLSLPLVILFAVAGDFLGTIILYFIFYLFGEFIMAHKPKWLPISREKIYKFGEKISKRERWGIYVGRLLPYLRAYIAVAAGLLEIKPAVFVPAVIIPAVIWSCGYTILGQLAGHYWSNAFQTIGVVEQGIAFVIAAGIVYFLIRYWLNFREKRKKSEASLR